jgi:hypothetical protein
MLRPATLSLPLYALPTLGFIVFASALSCEDETTEAQEIALDQFIKEFRAASCDRLVRCTYVPDLAACEATIPTDRGMLQAIASVTAGELTYDPAQGRACVDAVRSYKCEGDYFLPRALREACDQVVGNRKGEGAACFHASECQGIDADCEGACSDECCQGKCKLAGGTSGLGLACDGQNPCPPDLVCLSNNEGGGGGDPGNGGGGGAGDRTCQPRVGPGESCDQPYECTEGYGCDPVTRTCFKQADSGAQCNPLLNAPGCAALAEYCDETQARCIPLPGEGQPCVSNGFLTDACALYARCVGGTCQRLPGPDQPCLSGQCLGLLRCSSGGGQGGDGGGPAGAVCEPLSPAPVCLL